MNATLARAGWIHARSRAKSKYRIMYNEIYIASRRAISKQDERADPIIWSDFDNFG